MKTKYFKHLCFAVMSLISVGMAAHDVEINGIYYKLNKTYKYATVTYRGNSYDAYTDEYSGSVTLPAAITIDGDKYNVTSIGANAFRECTSLASVSIPESVTDIGSLAFFGCSGLTEPVYNKKIFAILPASYQGDYIIPSGIETICGFAFYGCRSLISLTIPESVTNIRDGAFDGCTGELIICCDIPNGGSVYVAHGREEYISYSCASAFTSSKLSSIRVNGKSIGNYSFYGLSSIKHVELGKNITYIGKKAFSGCSGELIINCNKIEGMEYDANENKYVGPLTESEFMSVRMNGSTIGERAFLGLRTIQNVELGEDVTNIESDAFYNCSCLTTLIVHNPVPVTIQSSTFTNSAQVTLYVPAGSEEAYRAADYWKDFKAIVSITGVEKVQGPRLEVQGEAYDLFGRKIQGFSTSEAAMPGTSFKVQRGIYIVNGKKVLK